MDTWLTKVDSLILELCLLCWKDCNEFVHGKTKAESDAIIWNTVHQQVEQLYSKLPILAVLFPTCIMIPLMIQLKNSM